LSTLFFKKTKNQGNTAQLKLRRFAEILCPDFGFGSLREFRPRCRDFTAIHQVLPQTAPCQHAKFARKSLLFNYAVLP
jgi:hypothetical protein